MTIAEYLGGSMHNPYVIGVIVCLLMLASLAYKRYRDKDTRPIVVADVLLLVIAILASFIPLVNVFLAICYIYLAGEAWQDDIYKLLDIQLFKEK